MHSPSSNAFQSGSFLLYMHIHQHDRKYYCICMRAYALIRFYGIWVVCLELQSIERYASRFKREPVCVAGIAVIVRHSGGASRAVMVMAMVVVFTGRFWVGGRGTTHFMVPVVVTGQRECDPLLLEVGALPSYLPAMSPSTERSHSHSHSDPDDPGN